ncbi:MAG: cysteine--tRNA ligase [Myxococcota bacterium]
MDIYFFNTLSRQVEKFTPLQPGKVGFYACGPTVYSSAHIGNLRTYVFEDIVRRTLQAANYEVQHVMNVTDVGHLESDADDGDDKMSLAAQREQKSPWEIAKAYEKRFFADCEALHLLPPNVICRATEHIELMQQFIEGLQQKGLTYEVDGNVYYSTSQFEQYGKLWGGGRNQDCQQARVESDPRKQNPCDFVLWFSQSKFPHQIMKWPSPWGEGFPGWHIECSAMASRYLGERIDIHAGGIDHVSVHHTNEIAQSEGLFGHKWVNYWLHGEFLVLHKEKMAKSQGNTLTLQTLRDHGFDPLHYRYLCLTAHYRKQLLFSWEALQGAKNSFEALKNRALSWKFATGTSQTSAQLLQQYRNTFWQAVAHDLGTPSALACLWDLAKDQTVSKQDKWTLIQEFDQILGLGVASFTRPQLEPHLQKLIDERQHLRQNKQWQQADQLRDQLLQQGVQVQDTPTGSDWYLCYRDE